MRASIGAGTLAALAVAIALPPGASAAERWADPTVQLDQKNPCTKTVPCHLARAVNGAGKGDVVIVKAGSHVLTRTGITLDPPFGGVTIKGDPSGPRPEIVSDSDQVLFLDNNSTASWLTIRSTGANAEGLAVADGSASQIYSRSDGASSTPCAVLGSIDNVACLATGRDSNAVESVLSGGRSAKPQLRNVTAVATQPDSSGIYVKGDGEKTSVKLGAVNVIAAGGSRRSGGFDVFANAAGASTAAATLDYSNYASVQLTSGATATPAGSAQNQTAAPVFKSLDMGDLREDNCSPTKNAGFTDPKNGQFDGDGNPRVVGGKTDIGAFESIESCGVGRRG